MRLFLELFGRELSINLAKPAPVEEPAEPEMGTVAAVVEIAPPRRIGDQDEDLGRSGYLEDGFGFGRHQERLPQT